MYLLHHSQKNSLRRTLKRLSSFTLVEMLAVVAIIAILAAVLLPTANWAIKAAKRAKALNTASQIQTAAMAYYTEYSVYPVPGGTSGDYLLPDSSSANDTSWGNLICSLCGNIAPSTALAFAPVAASPTNARGVAFLNMKASDVDANNAPLNPLPSSTTVNLYFNIAMDSDYDGLLGSAGNTLGKIPNFATSTQTAINYTGTSTAGVIVWANCNGNTTSTNANYWVHTY